MYLSMKLQPPEIEAPVSQMSNSEHHVRKREVYREPLAEHGNLVRQKQIENPVVTDFK